MATMGGKPTFAEAVLTECLSESGDLLRGITTEPNLERHLVLAFDLTFVSVDRARRRSEDQTGHERFQQGGSEYTRLMVY
jgi:hypothetical protein